MEVKLISTIRWLEVTAESGFYDLLPTISVVTDRKFVVDSLDDQFRRYAGEIEFQHLMTSDHVVACRPRDVSAWEGYEHSEPLLLTWLVWLGWLIEDSWLVKDNAIGCEIAYCNLKVNGINHWTNNGLFSTITKATGEGHVPVSFSGAELQEWARSCDELRSHLHSKGYRMGQSPVSKDTTRFDRFLNFITSSRTVPHPPLKIAQICSALESLFSTSTGELTHRLSERVALFLGGSADEMEARYQFMKKAYAIRSQVTHGSHIRKGDIDAAPSISVGLLDLCREIVFAVLRDEDKQKVVYGSNDQIEDYFRKEIFR